MYQIFRGGVSGGLELGVLAVGGYSIARGAYNITQRTFSLSRTPITIQKISPPTTTLLRSQGIINPSYKQVTKNP